ncbi:hypothetical protein ACQP2T_63625 (plasmid) [Nonomuraea sp. CA-143628]|uniref:hypothetical protein n=1 Tax=Nonomuraea sp. CA-143628 TaxID=3239997 RepID=UPI003D89E5B2
MSPAQMKATLAKVKATTRESIQHAADFRRSEPAFAIDESRCTDSRCSSGCSCGRTR